MELTTLYDSPLGTIALSSDGKALTGLWFGEPASSPSASPVFDDTLRWLDVYFGGREPRFMPPVALHGTDFQLRVWHELTSIPYGHTTTYGELAQHIGCRSPQAVGGAVGRNPISIIIPCHRVVGACGSPTGYAWGIDRKLYLLGLESRRLLFLPDEPGEVAAQGKKP